MTKRAYREKQRISPLGEAGVAAIRDIVTTHGYGKVNEVMVDATSAHAFIAVYDAINEKHQANLRSFCPGQAMDIVWKLVS